MEMKSTILLILLIGAFSSKYQTTSIEKGKGISDQKLEEINQILTEGRKIFYRQNQYKYIAYGMAHKMKELDRQYWVTEIFYANNLTYGISGLHFMKDQWVLFTYYQTNCQQYAFLLIYVPFLSEILPRKPMFMIHKTFINRDYRDENKITCDQQKMILDLINIAELLKGDNLKNIAVYMQKKLEEASGIQWVVQIFGSSDYWSTKWTRKGNLIKNRLFYSKHQHEQFASGQFYRQYFIWEPMY